MISPMPSTPPLPPAKKTPPRHDGSASRIQEDDGEGSLLNRMREVVLTHYRNSPSAPDRPIDLTHFKDTSRTLTSSLSTNTATQTSATTASMIRDVLPSIPMPSHTDAMYDDDDDDEEYVPPGLADFVANVNRELEQQQNAFLNDPSYIISDDRVHVEDMFYAENQTFDTVPTDEHNTEYTDEEPGNVALKNDILQRCDLLQRDALHSDYNQEYIRIDPSRIDHALTWSPDIFTSPTPINPASLLTVSQIKHQAFTSPIMTPIPPPPKNGTQTDKEMRQTHITIHEEPATSPLHALPQFTLSETNRCMKASPTNVKEIRSDDTLPHSLENIRLLPSVIRTESQALSVDQSLSCGQEVLLIDEQTQLSQHDPNHHVPSLHQYPEDPTLQPNLATASVSQGTPSTLSMASPSKGMTEKINQTLGHRASSPIYGYAPSPEYNTGMVHGVALTHPPPPLHKPPTQLNRSLSLEPLSVQETTRRTPQSPSAGSLLERATKRLQSASQCDELEAKSIGVKPIGVVHAVIPGVQKVQPIVRTESQEEKKTMTPSPKQKFTNRPPQNKPISTPSPLPTGNSVTRIGNETKRNPQDRQSDSYSIKNYASPTKASISPSLAVSETPSPLSMSSPGGYDTRSAFEPSSATRKSDKKVGVSPVPRFRTPPSPSRVKTAPRFTAEAAERLSRPSKSPKPPTSSARRSVPHYASPLKKSAKAEKHVSAVVVSSQVMRKSPMISPPVCSREIKPMDLTTKDVVTKLSISSINRLAAPSSTESRRRSAVEHGGTSKFESSTKKTLTSPPIVHSSSDGPKVSAKANRTSNSPIPQRRSVERILRGKSLKTGGRISPRVALSQPSTEKTLPIDVSNDKGTPRNGSQFSPSYKLSSGFEKSFRLNMPNTSQDKPHAALRTATNSSKSNSSDIIDRLSRPTQARAIAINCTLNPPPTDEEVEEPIPVVAQRAPSPFILTTVERLTKPTIARKAAMQPLHKTPRQPAVSSRPGVTGKDSRRLPPRNSESTIANQSPKLPSPLDSSSHLLTATAVSIAKKTGPKKAASRPPTPTRFVSGASDRLTKPTASYRAAILSRTAGSNKSQIKSGKDTSKNANILKQSHVVPRTLTVPRGPRCANLPPSNTQHRSKECIDPPSLAQVLNTFGKGLRDDYSVGSAGSNFSRRSLTIPTGPTLATDIRGGEKYRQPKMNSDVTLADSNTLLQNGLRSPYHSKQGRQNKGPTIPISPKFAVLPSRKPPKSRSDLEAEEMEYSKDHQFKAKPPLHSTMHHSTTPSHQANKVPGFMRPTKAATLSSREMSHSSAARTQSAVTLNKLRGCSGVHKYRQGGLPSSIVTTNLGFAQRVPVHDDGLKDLVEQAARAANILAIREEARQEKLAQEELERRELATFKAKPIPRTTYEYNPVVPAPTVTLVEPFSPELQTKQRMKERKAFDEYAEQERLAKMEREQAMEDARRADEDEEIKERRRLPVSEGGMIPVAGPINVVL